MAAYLLRRLLLIIPTLIGIMVVNFTLTQFVPGGPIEQVIAKVRGEGDAFANIAGGSGDSGGVEYAGAQGLPPEFIAELEKEGFVWEIRGGNIKGGKLKNAPPGSTGGAPLPTAQAAAASAMAAARPGLRLRAASL